MRKHPLHLVDMVVSEFRGAKGLRYLFPVPFAKVEDQLIDENSEALGPIKNGEEKI